MTKRKRLSVTTGPARVLSVAARAERIGCVVLENGELMYWEGSSAAAIDAEAAADRLRRWLRASRSDVLVSEDPVSPGSKHGKQLAILMAFAEVGDEEPVISLQVSRQRPFQNVYEEARHLAEQFPDLAEIVPEKPPIWGKEPYNLVFFEALALVRDGGLLEIVEITDDEYDSENLEDDDEYDSDDLRPDQF